MSERSTIFALSSAPGRAGVAVVRISGPRAAGVLLAFTGAPLDPRRAALRRITDPATGELLDRALVLFFAAPATETGEDLAEFQLHGSRAVIRAVLASLATQPGCRLAEPGEFARRAFLNGKLDLVAVEGLGDLIEAETAAQRRQALAQAGGAASKQYEQWRRDLIEARGLFEAAIDFSDEGDVASDAVQRGLAKVARLATEMRAALADRHRGEIVRDGFHVVILGAPNSGKSSLMNALARRDVAIVSDEAGTTRDLIEVRLDIGGLPVVLTDTAGLRQTESKIEQEGIRRALTRAEAAQLIVWLVDDTMQPAPDVLAGVPVLKVLGKCDLAGRAASDGHDLAISSLTGAGLEALIERIEAAAQGCLGDADAKPLITQARHRFHLAEALAALEACLSEAPEQTELRAEDVRRAGDAVGRITGRIDVEDVLDHIFGRFCIGK